MSAPTKRQIADVTALADEFDTWTRADLLMEIRRLEQEESRLALRRHRARLGANRLPETWNGRADG